MFCSQDNFAQLKFPAYSTCTCTGTPRCVHMPQMLLLLNHYGVCPTGAELEMFEIWSLGEKSWNFQIFWNSYYAQKSPYFKCEIRFQYRGRGDSWSGKSKCENLDEMDDLLIRLKESGFDCFIGLNYALCRRHCSGRPYSNSNAQAPHHLRCICYRIRYIIFNSENSIFLVIMSPIMMVVNVF